MTPAALKEHRTALTAAALLVFMLVAVLARITPHALLIDGSFTNLVANDAWYNLRQIEAMVINYPGYAWFDPMTAYPTGKEVAWGPLFPFIAATFCIITGAATRPEIVYAAAWIPPLLAAAVIPPVYLIGKTIADRLTGLIAAGLISIVSAAFFVMSLFGYVDHHVAETLFSTLFCLVYIAALVYAARHPVSFREYKTILPVALLGLGAGFAYLLGLLVMPTMILFALIAGVFTLVQAVRNHLDGTGPEGLLVVNITAFVVPVIFLPLSGFMVDSQNLSLYSVAHIYAYLLLIAATVLLSGISVALKDKRNEYLGTLAAVGIAGAAFLAFSEIGKNMANGLTTFFGRDLASEAIREMGAWEIGVAWNSINVGLLLIPAGLAILALRARRENRPELLFTLVWSVLILIATIQHLRFEYYLSVNLALLAAIFIAWALDHGLEKTVAFFKETGDKKEKTTPTGEIAVVGIAVLLAVTFVGVSAAENIGYAGDGVIRLTVSDDWRGALEWMNANTPDPGVDYHAIYEKDGFSYPEDSYSVMSWWDHGHEITFIAGRIPVTNPFQDHVNRATRFFLATSENDAEKTIASAGSRYIITDSVMADDGFPGIVRWHDQATGTAPYVTALLMAVPEKEDTYTIELFYRDTYYQTMVVRLHNLDGTMIEPSRAIYAEYDTGSVPTVGYPLLVRGRTLTPDEARATADSYRGSRETDVFGMDALTPPVTIPALNHYRLIYESSPNATENVKIFERVKGAVIPGEGIIEVTVVTNSGREFVYRQAGENGMFVVPYSTTGNPYDVRTVGGYRIVGGTDEFTVTEEAVTGGAESL